MKRIDNGVDVAIVALSQVINKNYDQYNRIVNYRDIGLLLYYRLSVILRVYSVPVLHQKLYFLFIFF